jgi:hypothetical protein
MPFTTMNNYDWLFDVDILDNHMTLPIDNSVFPSQHPAASTSNHLEHSRNSRQSKLLCRNDTTTIHNSSYNNHERQSKVSSEFDTTKNISSDPDRNPSILLSITSAPNSSVLVTPSGSSTSEGARPQASSEPASNPVLHEAQLRTISQAPATRPSNSTPSNTFLAFGRTCGAENLPVIDEITRHHLLDLIVQANPKMPDGAFITREHPLLSLPDLQVFCDLFFCRFNVTYPLIHRATFEPSQVEPLLLVSILLLGATYGDKSGHGLAVCIHDVLRAQIFQNAAFKAQPDLWILQTILLVECFGKSRAGQTQHDMSHLFHGLLIK